MELEKIGEWAFVIGVILAFLLGVFSEYIPTEFIGWSPLILVILGIIVGLLNIKDKETTPFLIASIALLATGAIGTFSVIDKAIPLLGTILTNIFEYVAVFVAPAAVIVALVAIKNLAMKH